MKLDLETILPWGPAKRVSTRNGDRMLRKAAPNDAFSAAWKSNKDALKASGISWSKDERTGEWSVVWWQPLDAGTVAKETAAVEASRATDADVTIPCPDGLAFLPFQKAGVKFMSERQATLLCDSVGLGKTVQAIGVVNMDASLKKILVVCPATLKTNWRNELRRWLVRPSLILVVDGKPSVDFRESFLRCFALHDQKGQSASNKAPNAGTLGKCPIKQIALGEDSARMVVGLGSDSFPAVSSETIEPLNQARVGLVNTNHPSVRSSGTCKGTFPIENASKISTVRELGRSDKLTSHSSSDGHLESSNPPLMSDGAKVNTVFAGDSIGGHSVYVIGKTGFPNLTADDRAKSLHVVIVNYDVLQHYHMLFNSVKLDLLIADECHAVKNRAALRTKLLLGAVKKADKEQFPGVRARRKVFMTATPILNRPIEIFPLLESLEPGKWTFKDKIKYCAGFEGRWGWDFTGAAHLDELQNRLRSTIMCRRLKSEVMKELPPIRRQLIELSPNGKAGLVEQERDSFEQHEDELRRFKAQAEVARLGDDESGYKAAVDALKGAYTVAFTEIAKMRHQIAVAKVPSVIEHAEDLLEDTKKIVIFTHHHDVTDSIAAGLTEHGVLMGDRKSVV